MPDVTTTTLTTRAQWREAFPVMRQLRPDLDEATYLSRLEAMCEDGYRLFALSVDGDVVSLAGVAVRTNLNDGRYAWVYDLVTDEAHRSRGHGARLLGHVESWAADQGCTVLALASGRQRTDAHRFYEASGLTATSYVFKRSLERPA